METNKLATHAIHEPVLGAFILKKIFFFIDDYTLKECINQLNEDDKMELAAIMSGMGFKDEEIEKLIK